MYMRFLNRVFIPAAFFNVKIGKFVGGNSRQSSHFRCLACWVGPFQVLFRCPRPLNRGVRLIKISFKANTGNKFWDFGCCPLNTVSAYYRFHRSWFQSLWVELQFWIPVVCGIPDSLSCIPDSKAQDSRFHKQNFPGFGNPDSLTWGDIPLNKTITTGYSSQSLIYGNLYEKYLCVNTSLAVWDPFLTGWLNNSMLFLAP